MTKTPNERLAALGFNIPPTTQPSGNFLPYRFAGSLLFLSGQAPWGPDGKRLTGRVPDQVSPEEAYRRARLSGLQLLSAAHAALGSLDRVESVVKLLGMVYSTAEFGDHPSVINGCSDLFVEVFGEQGRHARSAVGMGSLPHQITVEVEAILLVSS